MDFCPDRPARRGSKVVATGQVLSFADDASFQDFEKVGAKVELNAEMHTVEKDMFLVSGQIPRETSYEKGLPGALRLKDGIWISDELIMDERWVVMNLKGMEGHSVPFWNQKMNFKQLPW